MRSLRRAALALGVLPTTLHEKMRRLGLVKRPRPSFTVAKVTPPNRLLR